MAGKQQIPIEVKVKNVREYKKELKSISFSMSPNQNGTCRIRVGKRYILCDCPAKDFAIKLVSEIQAVINKNIVQMDEIIDLLTAKAEQMELELFKNKESGDVTEGLESRSDGSIKDPA